MKKITIIIFDMYNLKFEFKCNKRKPLYIYIKGKDIRDKLYINNHLILIS